MEKSDKTAKSPRITPALLTDILTLRYDTSLEPPFHKIRWSDFANSGPDLDPGALEGLMVEELKNRLGDAGRTVSISLSGGTDSTLAAAVFRKIFPNAKARALCVSFANSADESGRASEIAAHLGLDLRIIHVNDFLADLPKMIGIVKRPFWDLHWYHVAKEAGNMSKHLITGNGGDEFFGGYTFRYRKFLALAGDGSPPLQRVRAYVDCHIRDWVPDQDRVFGAKCAFDWNRIYGCILPYFENSLPPLSQVFLADCNGKLAHNFAPLELLLNGHFGIESVSPLMSQNIARRAVSLPNRLKYDSRSNRGKLLLQDALKRLKCEHLVCPKKMGFSVNTVNLWQNGGRDACGRYLLDSRLARDGWISGEWIRSHIGGRVMDARYVNKFLGLLAFEIWYRMFETREIKPGERL